MPYPVPIFLPAPPVPASGPDGQGWNRLRIELAFMAGDECLLRPRSFAALWEVRNNRTGTYGAYGPCIRAGRCEGCPVLTAEPRQLGARVDRVLARIVPQLHIDDVWVVDDPSAGWASPRSRWTWPQLARLRGWELGDTYRDEHGAGFWLQRVTGEPGAGR